MNTLQKFSIIIILVILSGCQSLDIDNIGKSNANSTNAVGQLTITPSPPHFQSISATVMPTKPRFTQTSTPKIQLTRTRRNTATSTPTPLDTLTIDEYQTLIASNRGCDFPCWLGIIPGKTSGNEAKRLLESYFYRVEKMQSRGPGYEVYDRSNRFYANIYLRDEIVDTIDVSEPFQRVPIWEIMSKYGKPGEVRINMEGRNMGLGDNTTGQFDLVLFYPDIGVMGVYYGYSLVAEKMKVCFSEAVFTRDTQWFFWDYNKKMSFFEAGDAARLPANNFHNKDEYPPLADISELTVDDFYQEYLDQQNKDRCFSVPNPDWNQP